VAHSYNPSYSGEEDQEESSSRTAQAKVPQTSSQAIEDGHGDIPVIPAVGNVSRRIVV
jgi:hypothetical protein